ncbi:MAG: biopolymer transporter ExbD [Deltaproteobacteria bacterium]|jgi:biopolymer transport protein TolR|nr:biopolymer transporter ExbD [Deltaproteobacteria bacterium]
MTEPQKKGYQKAGSGTGTYSHGDFTFVRKKRSKGSHIHEEEGAGELNIVPYLDIIINLIMFLLVAQATLVSLGMIDVTAPSYVAAGPGGGDPTTQEKQLRLTVGIAAQGFYIAARGGVIPGQEEAANLEMTAEGVTRAPPTVPKKPDGTYDYPTLARKLRAIKALYPDATAVYVAAEDTTPYEVIVKALDSCREDAQGMLFPNVAFSQIN